MIRRLALIEATVSGGSLFLIWELEDFYALKKYYFCLFIIVIATVFVFSIFSPDWFELL